MCLAAAFFCWSVVEDKGKLAPGADVFDEIAFLGVNLCDDVYTLIRRLGNTADFDLAGIGQIVVVINGDGP